MAFGLDFEAASPIEDRASVDHPGTDPECSAVPSCKVIEASDSYIGFHLS